MSEKFNQTAEIALRYYIATLDDIRIWPKVFSRMSISLNNSINYNSTIQVPNQIIYGFRTCETLNLLRYYDPEIEISHTFRNDIEIFGENHALRNDAGIFKKNCHNIGFPHRRSNGNLTAMQYKC